MLKTYEIKGTATGTLKSSEMDLALERGYIDVEFYDDGTFTNQIAPNFGTVTFTGSRNDMSYFSISNGTVKAVRTGATGRYSLPTMQGPVRFIKAAFDGLSSSATHVIVTISKYGDK